MTVSLYVYLLPFLILACDVCIMTFGRLPSLHSTEFAIQEKMKQRRVSHSCLMCNQLMSHSSRCDSGTRYVFYFYKTQKQDGRLNGYYRKRRSSGQIKIQFCGWLHHLPQTVNVMKISPVWNQKKSNPMENRLLPAPPPGSRKRRRSNSPTLWASRSGLYTPVQLPILLTTSTLFMIGVHKKPPGPPHWVLSKDQTGQRGGKVAWKVLPSWNKDLAVLMVVWKRTPHVLTLLFMRACWTRARCVTCELCISWCIYA